MVKKRIFAVICAVVVVALSVVPCFADVWIDEAPTYATAMTASVEQASSQTNTDNLLNAVDLATTIGLFGGAKPVAIIYNSLGSGRGFYIEVMTPAVIGQTVSGLNKYTDVQAGVITPATSGKLCVLYNSSAKGYMLWRMGTNGDWYPYSIITSSSPSVQLYSGEIGAESAGAKKLVAYWSSYYQQWRPGANLAGAEYATGSNTNTQAIVTAIGTISQKYADIANSSSEEMDEWYDQGYTDGYDVGVIEGYEEGVRNGSATLEIPAIFDSMFAGARSIMSAFDIEIFGINIIGTLVAVLVITIIAFVVRKLWK